MKDQTQPIRVTRTDKHRSPEQVRKLGRALIALARTRLEAEAQAQAEAAASRRKRAEERATPPTGDAA